MQGTTYLATGPVLSVDGGPDGSGSREVPMTDIVSVGTAPTIKTNGVQSGTGQYTTPSGYITND